MSEHLLRDLMLDSGSGASVAMLSGSALPLYPIANLYNSRSEISFRTDEESFIIDIDLGSEKQINMLVLLACNLHNLSPFDRINVKADTVFPPVAYDQDQFPWFGNPGAAPLSDLLAAAAALTAFGHIPFFISASYRYFRITIDQAGRKTDYSEIGEIFFDTSGDDWFLDKLAENNRGFELSGTVAMRKGEQSVSFNWPATGESMIQFERNAKVRVSKLSASFPFYADEYTSGYNAELTLQSRNLLSYIIAAGIPIIGVPSFPMNYVELRKDQWRSEVPVVITKQLLNGNGKVD